MVVARIPCIWYGERKAIHVPRQRLRHTLRVEQWAIDKGIPDPAHNPVCLAMFAATGDVWRLQRESGGTYCLFNPQKTLRLPQSAVLWLTKWSSAGTSAPAAFRIADLCVWGDCRRRP